MACYLITYDLNEETNRPNILKDIKAYEHWAKLSESSYAITTYDSSDQVFDKLSKHLDDNDSCYVISLSYPHSGQGSQEVNEWLDNSLPR